ncbi:MAG: DUF4857 domain-containing protein [Bacteroidales bacterium]
MKRILHILFWAVMIGLFAQFLPSIYNYVFVKVPKSNFTLYSSVSNEFVHLKSTDTGMIRENIAGTKNYTESQFDSILPFFYLRQLVSEGRFPDSINGKATPMKEAQRYNFMFRYTPTEYFKERIDLYPLFESMSGRVDLKMPDDFMRINKDGVWFLVAETNSTDTEKSELFTNTFIKEGFKFPASNIWGNPSPKKEYDEGYFIKDAEDKLFHLKMMRNRPFIREVSQPENQNIEWFNVTEFRNRAFFGVGFDKNGNVYMLQKPGYDWVKLPVAPFDIQKDRMLIVGEPINWTIHTTQGNTNNYYAISATDYSVTDTYQISNQENIYTQIAKFIFPFEIKFTTPNDEQVKFRIENFSALALIFNLIIATFVFLNDRKSTKESLVILLFGLYAFIPYILYRKYFTN